MNTDKIKHMARQAKAHRATIAAVLVGMGVLLSAYFVAQALWFATISPQFDAQAMPVQQAARGQRWAWFGAPVKAAAKPQKEVKESRLNAKLLGIVLAGENSIALIDTGDKKASNVFKEGDKLNRSVSVHRIEADRVLIIERGVITSLTLETNNAAQIKTKSTGRPVPGNATRLNSLLPSNLKSSLLAGITFSPTRGGGTGMNLGSLNPKMLVGTGLKSGDVVTAAGGTPIDQILNSPNSYQNLLQLDNIDITIERNGNEESVSINPRSVVPNVMRLIATQNR